MAPPHVAVAVLCGVTGGPATYGRRLIESLAQLGEVRLSVLTDRPEQFERATRLAGSSHACEAIDVPMRGGIDRLRWQHLAVPKALSKLRPDVYHDTKNALPLRLRCPSVVTVHDLAYHTVPESFGFASRLFLRRSTRTAVRRAQAIVVPSQATATDLNRIYPNSLARTHVVPHGIDKPPELSKHDRDAAAKRIGLPGRYVLHVGTIQARKNVDLVVQGVRELRTRGIVVRAVIVGRKGWLSERACREIERDDTAIWHEHLSHEDLAVCYQRAAAFASPSAYEGFGFTVADALAAGVPTVVANISSLPELCGDAAVLLPELSGMAVANALEPLLTDSALSQDLATRGQKRAQQFDWQACAAGHVRAYHAALAATGQ